MNPTRIAAALKTVEQDHQMVLDKIHSLRQTIEQLLILNGDPPGQLLKQFRDIHAYFATQFETHMEEEETTLLPLLEAATAEDPELVERLRHEHDEIRRMRAEFGNCLDVADQLAERLPKTVLRDLLVYAWELWDELDRHAYTETHALHFHVLHLLAAEHR